MAGWKMDHDNSQAAQNTCPKTANHLRFATKTTTYLTSDSQQRWQRTSPPIRNKDDNAQFKSREFTKWNQSLSFIPIVFKVSGR